MTIIDVSYVGRQRHVCIPSALVVGAGVARDHTTNLISALRAAHDNRSLTTARSGHGRRRLRSAANTTVIFTQYNSQGGPEEEVGSLLHVTDCVPAPDSGRPMRLFGTHPMGRRQHINSLRNIRIDVSEATVRHKTKCAGLTPGSKRLGGF